MKIKTCRFSPHPRPDALLGRETASPVVNRVATGYIFVKKNRPRSIIFFLLAACILVFGLSAHAGQDPLVVLDPGHGGQDPGALLPGDTRESQTTLSLANKIYALLDAQGGCRVILTRDGDYGLPLHERAGMAAHNQARIFISLHAGSGWGNQGSPKVLIAYYEARIPALTEQSRENQESRALTARSWESVASSQKAGSHKLSAILREELGKSQGADRVRTGGYPFAVLAGADAPAVLLDFTGAMPDSPSQEALLDKLARDIARSIVRFLKT
ncbi:MAG: N-acetylmuramoyl-L-alanine amidase [Desulfatibacillum sp.]|nr:N-acetylmuramoyl-L-alanine amidase [Desulfatibacillum sp.]